MDWCGQVKRPAGEPVGVFTGRDPRTGRIVQQFPPDVSTYWFHHRCYRGKATENYLLMARTGTEFIDVREEHWDIHHWVRGACLYGVMPANGLLYAPRHPCACYLEAKLSGFNALAPAGSQPRACSPHRRRNDSSRVQRIRLPASPWTRARPELRIGPLFAMIPDARGVPARGFPRTSPRTGPRPLAESLTSPVIAAGHVYVASRDDHTVHCLEGQTGREVWRFRADGRVDSPPTYYRGYLLFGSADGHVYCLALRTARSAWRFLAAHLTEQLVDAGQLESVWPVHGSILIENDIAYFVAGRSMFLDDGLILWRLDPLTGAVLSQTALNDVDVEGKKIQDYVSWLNMPTALPDVLSSTGRIRVHALPAISTGRDRLALTAMPRKSDADQALRIRFRWRSTHTSSRPRDSSMIPGGTAPTGSTAARLSAAGLVTIWRARSRPPAAFWLPTTRTYMALVASQSIIAGRPRSNTIFSARTRN